MAKSMRSKVKRSFRRDKRTVGVYAATEAARLNRLNARLIDIAGKDKDGDVPIAREGEAQEAQADAETSAPGAATPAPDAMDLDAAVTGEPKAAKPISTHGPRNSRREAWRSSKGMVARPVITGVNRQGIPTGKRKAGRSKRRR